MALTKVYFKCTIYAKSMADSSEQELILTSAYLNESIVTAYPIIQNISGLGVDMQELTPTDKRATLTLDDSLGSIGYQRRFSDLLEQYVVNQQDVSIWHMIVDGNDSDSFGDTWVQIWGGIIDGVSFRKNNNNTISLELYRASLPVNIITNEITLDKFPNAPEQSVGKVLPIVIGNQQVEPVLIDEQEIASSSETDWPFGSYSQWAYATTMGASEIGLHPEQNGYYNQGIVNYYLRGEDDKWRGICSASENESGNEGVIAYILSSPDTDLGLTGHTYASIEWTAKELAWLFRPMTSGVALTSIKARFFKWTDDDYNITCKLYRATSKPRPADMVETITIEVADIASIGSNTDYADSTNRIVKEATFILSAPLAIREDENIFISLSYTASAADVVPVKPIIIYSEAATISKYKYYDDDTTNQHGWYRVSNGKPAYLGLYGLEFHDARYGAKFSGDINTDEFVVADSDGLGYSSVYINSGTYSYGYEWRNLPIILSIDGLEYEESLSDIYDFSSVDTAIKRFLSVWGEGRWTSTNICDDTTFAETHIEFTSGTAIHYRSLAGKTNGRTTVKQLLTELARNCAIRLVPSVVGTKTVAYWGWGTTASLAITAPLTDEHAQIISLEVEGADAIVNRAQIFWNPKKLTDDLTYQATSETRDYTRSLDSDLSAYKTATVTLSQSLYGLKYLANNLYEWLPATAASGANAVTQWLLARYAFPLQKIKLRVPYILYYSLKLMDVFELVHADIPNYYGTSPAMASPGLETGAITDIAGGNDFRRANRLRGQLEGREIEYSVNATPTLILTLNILGQSPDDPT